MAKTTQYISIFPANGGLQSANNPALIGVNNLSDMNNLIFTNDSSRKTRPGRKRFDLDGTITEASNLKYVKDFWRYDSVSGSRSNKVIVVINGKVFSDTNANGSFQDITGPFIIPGTDNVTMDVFSNVLIMGFENVSPKYYNGSGNIQNLPGSPPNGSIYRTAAGYGWITGVQGLPDTVFRSGADDPFTWTGATAESILINDGDGDPIGNTAIFPEFYGDVYVSKYRSIYRLRMTSTGVWGLSLFLKGVGCISHNSIVPLQNDIIFCSERGVHSLASTQNYGDAESKFLSAPIHDVYVNQLDFSRAKQMNAAYIPEFNSYMITFPKRGSSIAKDVLGYNILTGQWYQYKGVDAQFLTQYINAKKKTQLMTGDSTGRISVFDNDQKNDYGSIPINSSFTTGIIYPLGPTGIAAFKSLTVVFKPQGSSTFSVTSTIDGVDVDTLSFDQSGGSADFLGSNWILSKAKLGRRGVVKTQVKPLSGQGRGIQLRFDRNPSGSNINQGMEVLGYIIEYKDSGTSDEASVQ